MKSKYLLPGALLTMAGWLMPLVPACAGTVRTNSGGVVLANSAGVALTNSAGGVLANSVGFIKGTQIFTDTFDLTTPGVLTVTLTAIPWLDTLKDLNCFLTSPSGGVLGSAFNGTSETMQVQAGDISVNWYGTAGTAGATGTAFNIGVYGINVNFQATAPVPLPASLPLLLSGLGALAVWRRKRRSVAAG